MISVVTSTAAAITTRQQQTNIPTMLVSEGGRKAKKLRARRLSTEFYVTRVKMTVNNNNIYTHNICHVISHCFNQRL